MLSEFDGEVRQSAGFYSVGIHPMELQVPYTEQLRKVSEALGDSTIVALGEVGFDSRSAVAIEEQENSFVEQAALAEKHTIPVVIHCVRRYNELIAACKKMVPSVPWVVHGFNKNKQTAMQLLDCGMRLSFGASVLTEHSSLHEVVRYTPLEYTYAETDMSDCEIAEVYHALARIKNCAVNEIALQFAENVTRDFTRLR